MRRQPESRREFHPSLALYWAAFMGLVFGGMAAFVAVIVMSELPWLGVASAVFAFTCVGMVVRGLWSGGITTTEGGTVIVRNWLWKYRIPRERLVLVVASSPWWRLGRGVRLVADDHSWVRCPFVDVTFGKRSPSQVLGVPIEIGKLLLDWEDEASSRRHIGGSLWARKFMIP